MLLHKGLALLAGFAFISSIQAQELSLKPIDNVELTNACNLQEPNFPGECESIVDEMRFLSDWTFKQYPYDGTFGRFHFPAIELYTGYGLWVADDNPEQKLLNSFRDKSDVVSLPLWVNEHKELEYIIVLKLFQFRIPAGIRIISDSLEDRVRTWNETFGDPGVDIEAAVAALANYRATK